MATSTHVQQFAAQENPDRSWIPPRTSFLTAHWLRTHLENRIYLGWQKWCSRGPDETQPQAYSELYSVSEKKRLEHCQQNQITGISICSLTAFFFLMWGESILYQSRGTSIPDRFGILSLEEAKLLMLPLSKDYPFRSFIIHNDLKAIIQKMMEKMPISNSMEQTGKYHDKDTVWK